jgi:hypothetical protein
MVFGQPPQFDAAMVNAIKRSIFARPAAANAPPSQTTQGAHGALGAPYGRPNGAIGAAVPQMGVNKRAGAAPANAPASAPSLGGGSPSPTVGAPGGGLAALLPFIALLAHLFGGAGGGIASTPRGGGTI